MFTLTVSGTSVYQLFMHKTWSYNRHFSLTTPYQIFLTSAFKISLKYETSPCFHHYHALVIYVTINSQLNYFSLLTHWIWLPLWLSCKESACNAGDAGLIPGLWWSPGGGNGNRLQCFCREIPMDRGAWWATVLGVTKSQTRLRNWTGAQTPHTLPPLDSQSPSGLLFLKSNWFFCFFS